MAESRSVVLAALIANGAIAVMKFVGFLLTTSPAMLIGIMLMVFAVALAWENKRLLLGESVPEGSKGKLRTVVETADGVDQVVDFQTTFWGPGQIVVVADVEFRDDLAATEISDRIDEIEARLRTVDQEVIAAYIEVEEAGESSIA